MYYIITKKNIVIFSSIFLILCILSISCFVFASNNSSWGLCFDNPNEVPRGNATSEELLKYNAYFTGNTDEKKVYLTFDVGYEAGYTNSILDTLKKHNIIAAFFIVGNYFDSDPDTVKRMYDEGHIVANHTLNHPNMSKMSTFDDFKAQIIPNEEKYKAITGQEMKKYYRPPQGIYNTQNLEDAKNLGYKTIFWSVAYVDWDKNNQPSHEKAMSTLLKRVHNGAIILLHSTSKTNMEILDELLTTLENEGYTFGSLDELGEN
jgi:peptidoglycan-N-acetylmuramic acid deacetylase